MKIRLFSAVTVNKTEMGNAGPMAFRRDSNESLLDFLGGVMADTKQRHNHARWLYLSQ